MDFLDVEINKDEITSILNKYSTTLTNRSIKESYQEYYPIYYNFKSLYFKKKLLYPSDLEFLNGKELNNIYFTLVFIYVNQIYPSYNASLLYYIYTYFCMILEDDIFCVN